MTFDLVKAMLLMLYIGELAASTGLDKDRASGCQEPRRKRSHLGCFPDEGLSRFLASRS